MCHDGKDMNINLIRTPMVGRGKLYLGSMDQMKNEQVVGETLRDL